MVVVNTCGFIDSAVTESLDAIGEAMNQNGKVIVTGCLGKRPSEIREAYPNVLAVSGPQDYQSVMEAVHEALPPKHDRSWTWCPTTASSSTPRHYAYLKIPKAATTRAASASFRRCAASWSRARWMRSCVKPSAWCVAGCVSCWWCRRTPSAYGVDVKYAEKMWRNKAYQTRLKALCEGLSELDAWVRMHYVYPYPHVDEIVPLMAENRILPYLDIPFQHASPRILRLMKRPGAVEKTLERVQNWRRIAPDITVRSTFIVGFRARPRPSSKNCCRSSTQRSWIASARSPIRRSRGHRQRSARCGAGGSEAGASGPLHGEAGTDLRRTPGGQDRHRAAVPGRCHRRRYRRGPFRADAPEIDGLVHIQNADQVPRVGEFVDVEITESDEHDLYGDALPAATRPAFDLRCCDPRADRHR